MASCAHCKTQDTELYVNGVPVCLRCENAPRINHKPPATEREIGGALLQSMLSAVSRNYEAARELDSAVAKARTGVQHPNGAQRIRDAAYMLFLTRGEMMAAHTRLNNFVERGIVPDDMKRTG